MFNHVEKKIKALSKVVFWVSVVFVGVVIAAVLFSASTYTGNAQGASSTLALLPVLPSLVIMILGIWLGALLMYGFGELIEKTKENNAYLAKIAENTSKDHI